MTVSTREGTLDEALKLVNQIPELGGDHSRGQWLDRLAHGPLILVGLVREELAGFKVGYDRWQDGEIYYSWMGGVLPQYRRLGVAGALQGHMESWCLQSGYKVLRFKTRNRHRNMISFAVRHGFDLVEIEKKGEIADYRLIFEKKLSNAITER